jgi:hypothetical protein
MQIVGASRMITPRYNKNATPEGVALVGRVQLFGH